MYDICIQRLSVFENTNNTLVNRYNSIAYHQFTIDNLLHEIFTCELVQGNPRLFLLAYQNII